MRNNGYEDGILYHMFVIQLEIGCLKKTNVPGSLISSEATNPMDR